MRLTRTAGRREASRACAREAYHAVFGRATGLHRGGVCHGRRAAVAGAAGARISGLHACQGRDPVPVAHLTVRAQDGIWLRVEHRGAA